MKMTWSQGILARATGREDIRAGQVLRLKFDNCIINDGAGHKAIDLLDSEKGISNRESVTVILDHDIPAGSFESAFIQKKLIDFARDNDTNFIQSAGTTYELMLNQVKEGSLAAVCGNHHGTFGINGALGIRLSPEEMAELLMNGEIGYKLPEVINVELAGKLPESATARDFMLGLVSEVGEEAFKGYVIEITGDAVKSLGRTDKFVICSLMSRTGAESVLIKEEKAEGYSKEFSYDLGNAKAVVTLPGDLKTVRTVDELRGTRVSAGFIGACTGGHIEDLRKAAEILKGKRVKLGFRLLIGCVSNETYLQAMEEGLIDVFFDFGAQFTNPGCSTCRTTSIGVVGDGESLISTGSYNFAGCAGTTDSKIYLASVETVARTAISGIIGE
ncbi:aconitase family protein [Youngiibacter fragilis]|uniref:3-isopropylmalate dehydratase n=1 Tax=Youngiibacter fragilis 232.1 TaxID=994573 RepID=V7I873_9CLOT|nr:aconitase family protein [Youngiibacter fragilis]ETA81449.1 3-isopropylmalate dehydratase [Youngiibacter fragilis 232.1]